MLRGVANIERNWYKVKHPNFNCAMICRSDYDHHLLLCNKKMHGETCKNDSRQII